jgi:hypothetical protein
MEHEKMMRQKDGVAGTQAASKQNEPGPEQRVPADQRARDLLEDDEVREALKSLHSFHDQRPKDA